MLKSIKHIEIIFHFLFWIVSFFIVINSDNMQVGVFNTNNNSLQGSIYYGMFFNALIFYSCLYIFLNRYKRKRLNTILIFIAIYFFISALETMIDMWFLDQYFYDARYSWNIKYFLVTNLVIHIAFISLAYIYGSIKLKFRIEESEQKLQIEKLDAELKFLKMQINPHFLFNTLNNLYGLARKENAHMTSIGIAKLSILMRYIIHEGNKNFISIEKEIEFINTYIEIQYLRFSKKDDISITFTTNGNSEGKSIPPLLLIVLIENAVKHGIHIEEKSSVEISLTIQDDDLLFIVTNTMHKYIQNEINEPSGLGLENLKRRLNHLLPNKCNLTFTQNSNIFIANLSIKL